MPGPPQVEPSASREPERAAQAATILRNALFTATARGVQIAVSYGVAVAVTRYLSVGDFGEYAFIGALVGAALSLADFGSQQILIREIARDRENAGEPIAAATVLRLAIAGVVIVAILSISPFLEISTIARRALLFAVLAEFFLSFATLTRTVFQAHEQMGYELLLALCGSLILAAGIGSAIFLRLDFPWLFGATALAHAVQLAAGAYLLRNRIVRPSFAPKPRLVLAFLKNTLVVGVGVFLFVNLIRVNVFMLKWLCTVEQVAFFQLPNTLVFQIMVLPLALVTAIFPVFSRLIHQGEPERMAGIYQKVFKYMFVLSLFFALSLSLFSREFIMFVFGAKYAPSVPVLAVLVWALVPLSMEMLLNSILVALDKQKYSMYYAGVALCFNVLAGYLLLPRFGAIGAAFLALISYCILFACSFSLVSRHAVAISLPVLLGNVAPAAAASVAVMMVAKPFTAVGALAAGTAIYGGVLYGFGVVLPAEIRLMRGAAKDLRPGGGRG